MGVFSYGVNGTLSGMASRPVMYFENPAQIAEPASMTVSSKHLVLETHQFLITLGIEDSDSSPLNRIFQIVTTEENDLVKKALTKSQGFVSRFFSGESWEAWTENKTALGKIVSIYKDFLEGSVNIERAKKYLDKDTVQIANREAIHVLENLRSVGHPQSDFNPLVTPGCTETLVAGSFLSVLSQNPLPLGVASLHCLTTVDAQTRPNPSASAAKRMQDRRAQIISRNDKAKLGPQGVPQDLESASYEKPELFDRTKEKLLEEIGERIPAGIKKVFTGGKNWVEAILNGIGGFVMDVTGIGQPEANLRSELAKIEDYYWYHTVYNKYLEIFRTPGEALTGQGTRDHAFVIRQIKDKLNQHGYHYAKYGTPIQFIEILKQRGVCETNSCRTEL